jgi:hypothetical protein
VNARCTQHSEQPSDTARHVSREIDSANEPCGRSHSSQYCAVSASRAAERLAPPPCLRAPRKKTDDPDAYDWDLDVAGLGDPIAQAFDPHTASRLFDYLQLFFAA